MDSLSDIIGNLGKPPKKLRLGKYKCAICEQRFDSRITLEMPTYSGEARICDAYTGDTVYICEDCIAAIQTVIDARK